MAIVLAPADGQSVQLVRLRLSWLQRRRRLVGGPVDVDLVVTDVAVGDRREVEGVVRRRLRQPPFGGLADTRRFDVSGRKTLGEQNLVCGGPQVSSQLSGGKSLEQTAQELLELRDHVQRRRT